MKRFWFSALLLCFAIGLSADDRNPATRSSPQGEKRPDMFPMSKGAQWESEVNVAGNTLTITQKMTEVSKKGDTTNATLSTEVNGQNITEEVSVNDKGLFRHSFNNFKLEKPMQVLKYPLTPQKWTENISIQGMEIEVKLEMKAPEDVTVPAGTYKKTIPVDINMSIQGQEITATNYYAEGVGIVKQDASLAGTKVSMVLKKYTPGEK